eukprot:Sspe_Gene.118058::Locus_110580_Transcript_1_2_Confidence_0.667_Length_798::g.118058::m.118058/K00587/ICMT, STE14; protein-S-isoprenylcysteine O-methyltransferase
MGEHRSLTNTEVGKAVLVAFGLGAVCALSTVGIAHGLSSGCNALVCLGFFAVSLCAFFMGEFAVCAFYRDRELSLASFLMPGLGAERAFNAAMLVAVLEFALEWFFVPHLKSYTLVACFGGVAAFLSIGIRILAMIQCSSNFAHRIEHDKRPEHRLVDTGLYSVLRHPSYFGWFWWSVSTQVALLNPVSIVGYAAASWVFFRDRIPYEEELLASDEFFGERYKKYRARTWVGIPFI